MTQPREILAALYPAATAVLFTTEEQLLLAWPENIFEKIWTVPGSSESCSLLGQVTSKNPTQKENPVPMQQNPNPKPEARHGP